ncbi:hypothetical protein L1049_002045 [Liquidambar formosana]|uniref:Uncharacterized protein n=1 Tax=Liquidambar formosana TaxID=63359 RepID=A0AAP0NE69_LIQFO
MESWFLSMMSIKWQRPHHVTVCPVGETTEKYRTCDGPYNAGAFRRCMRDRMLLHQEAVLGVGSSDDMTVLEAFCSKDKKQFC